MTKIVLVLHGVTNQSRKTQFDHVFCYARYVPGNVYVYQCIHAPLSPHLKKVEFDAIILNYCFLTHRSAHNYSLKRELYEFVRHSKAQKIAVCQDEYTLNEVLDDWLGFLRVDTIYSTIENNLFEVYPTQWKDSRVTFKLAYTGYVDRGYLPSIERFIRPHRNREVHIGTRVRRLGPHLGRHGVRKSGIAEEFAEKAKGLGLHVDISTDPKDAHMGSDWYDFLGRCRATVGSKGGASLLDPVGDIRRACDAYLSEHPDASFEEVEAACFPGRDSPIPYCAVGPRIFEAAALRTVQIMPPDNYLDLLEPFVDYIPLNEDFSNMEEIKEYLLDPEALERIADSCYDKLIASRKFEYEGFARGVIDSVSPRDDTTPARNFELIEAHDELMSHYRLVVDRLGIAGTHNILYIVSVLDRHDKIDLLRESVDLLRTEGLQSFASSALARSALATPQLGIIANMAARLLRNADALDAMKAILEANSQGLLAPIHLNHWDHSIYFYEPQTSATEA